MQITRNKLVKIIPIPAFEDNYIWLIRHENQAIVVDPGVADPVLNILARHQLNLHGILITHHHSDHIGGVAALSAAYPNALVYAPSREKFSFRHSAVSEPLQFSFSALPLDFSVIDLPGHTLGHVAYYATIAIDQHTQRNLLFCGDTLFGAGCGRLFEGTAEQLFYSLQKLAALPAPTEVYCAHEYTMHNIDFALTLEPDNKALHSRLTDTNAQRTAGLPSIPSTIALELETNPFLRTHSHAIQSGLCLFDHSPVEVFSHIRSLRNQHTYNGLK